jgi:hypothetical protein
VTYSHRDWCKAQQEFIQEVRNTSGETEENIQEIVFERACIHQLVTRNLIYNTNDFTNKWYAKGLRTKSSYLPPGVLMIKFESYNRLESFVETGDPTLFFRMWYPAPRGNPYLIKIGGLGTTYMHTLRRNLKLAMNSPDVVPNPIMLLILVESKWQYNRFYVFWISQKNDDISDHNLICVDDDTGVLIEKGNSLVFSSTERRPIKEIKDSSGSCSCST